MPLTKVTTAKGLALNAKIKAGNGDVGLPFIEVLADAGRSDDLKNLEDAVDPRLAFEFEQKKAVEAHAIITLMMTNQGNPFASPPIPPLDTAFSMQQMCWFAEDPDEGRILYQVWRFDIDPTTGSGIPYVPTGAERVWTYNPQFTVTISDAGVVTIKIVPNSLASRQSIWNSIELSGDDTASVGTRLHAKVLESIFVSDDDFDDIDGSGSNLIDSGKRITELRLLENPANPASPHNVILPITVPEAVIDPQTGVNIAQTLAQTAGSHPATSTQAGLMTPAMVLKLAGIEYNATNFVHPSTHPAAMIDESPERRFVSDEWLEMINNFMDGSNDIGISDIISRLAHIEWQLILQGILDGVDNVIVDTIDSKDSVILISGQFSDGRIFI